MTYEEAIKRVKEFGLHHAIADLPHSVKTVEAFNVAINELEKADKYAWHDLKKDPEDLPNMFTDEDTETVLVIDDLGEYHTAYYNHHFKEWLSDTYYKFEIIAWREIEPFKEDEE